MTTLKETQNIEFKSAWRDEHLKWICGFANAQGGSLFVGIEKMCAACKSYNAPEPQYIVHSNDIMILFKASEKYLELANNKATENYPESDQKTTQKILESIKSNPKISRKKLAEICGISSNGIKWQLKNLQDKGIIRRVGSDKGGHWEVIGK